MARFRSLIYVRLWRLVSALTMAFAASAASAASAGQEPLWSRPLPEPYGIENVAAGDGHLYVVWDDRPHGHTAAVSARSGRVLWHAQAANGADLLAAGGKAVWSASNVNGQLVEQNATDGQTVARFAAPGRTAWQALAATRAAGYALSGGIKTPLELSVYAGPKLVRRKEVALSAPAACTEAIGGPDLYLQCYEGADEAVYKVSETTGAILASSKLPPTTQAGVVYYRGSIYFQRSIHDEPRTVVRYDGSTLKVDRVSRDLELAGDMASSGTGIYAGIAAGRGAIVRLNPSTLSVAGSISIPTGRSDGWLAADASALFIVVSEHTNPARQTLLRLPLPR